MDHLEKRRRELCEEIDAFIFSPGDEERFNELCLKSFRYQYEAGEAYRKYCDLKGVHPESVTSWLSIPAYPSDAFKNGLVVSFPQEKAVMANITGGTTNPDLRGIILRDTYGRRLVFSANRRVMGDYLFPEGSRMPILVLAPSPKTAPSMGMAIGMSETIRHFGSEGSGFFITRTGMKVKELMKAMKEFERQGTPVALIGSTSAFIYLFNALRANGIRFALPAGSRLVDGGGYRGKFGDCTREEYYSRCREFLGVPEPYCVNVLGMAECSTNYVDVTLRETVRGGLGERRKPDLPWARVVAYDVETCSRPLPEGEVGLLRHFDLANLPTVLAVQTDNLGFRTADGFEIIGRAQMVSGKVSLVPSEKPVGPMGDRKIFSFLERYMKFAINRQVGRLKKDEAFCPCGEIIEEMLGGTHAAKSK